jgi:hypothetical protein
VFLYERILTFQPIENIWKRCSTLPRVDNAWKAGLSDISCFWRL